MLAQAAGQIAVEFDHTQAAQALHQRLRQRGQAGPDLHHRVSRAGGDCLHDRLDDALVAQEVLAETLARDVRLHAHWGLSRSST